MGEISEDLHDDIEGLDASAAHIANLLSTEPSDGIFMTLSSPLIHSITISSLILKNGLCGFVSVKVGIGGFSMGAAVALYSTTCYALGRYGTGHPYTINLRATVGLSGWLPGWRYILHPVN